MDSARSYGQEMSQPNEQEEPGDERQPLLNDSSVGSPVLGSSSSSEGGGTEAERRAAYDRFQVNHRARATSSGPTENHLTPPQPPRSSIMSSSLVGGLADRNRSQSYSPGQDRSSPGTREEEGEGGGEDGQPPRPGWVTYHQKRQSQLLRRVANQEKQDTFGSLKIDVSGGDENTIIGGGPGSPVVTKLPRGVEDVTDHEEIWNGHWATTSNQILDSLDFEEVENELLREERKKHKGHVEPKQWKVWIIIVLIGMMTGVVAFGINEGIKGLNALKIMAAAQFMETPKFNLTKGEPVRTEQIEFVRPFFIYVSINVLYVAVAAALVVFGEPVARGSGIGEIKCMLNGIRVFRVVRFKTLLCKATGIVFSVGAGLPVGKEGPMIHSGAAIASGIATGKSSKLHCDTGLFREFRDDRHKRNFLTAGAAAGVGAAFGAPIGGLLFAVEEVGSFWKMEITVMVIICSSITAWTLQFLQDAPTGGFFGSGAVSGLIDFGQVLGNYRFNQVPFFLLLGVIGGAFGAGFCRLNLILTRLRKPYVNTRFKKFVEVLIVSAMVSSVLICLVILGFKCEPIDYENSKLMEKIEVYGCPEGYYNDMATYFFHTMEESISLLIHSKQDIAYQTLLKQFIPYYFLTILTYGIHVPSGLFLPCLALGANFGHFYAQVWNYVLPESWKLDAATFALFGGMAILAGVTRMTISIVVIIMEATGNASFFFPLLIVSICAKFFGDIFSDGIYDVHIHFNHVPLLGSHMDRAELALLSARDLMNPSVVTLPAICTVGELIKVLKLFPYHNALCVVSDEGHFEGLLLRRSALVLIAKRAYDEPLGLSDFVKSANERHFLKLKKYHLLEVDPEVNNKTIDLLRYADRWPYTFLDTTPVPRVHRTFRELGLRHIVVLNNRREPVGIIGRKQLCYITKVEDNVTSSENVHSPTTWATLGSGRLHNEDGSEIPGGPKSRLLAEPTEDEWKDSYRKHVN